MTGPDGRLDDELVQCSAKGCRAPARHVLVWNNPKLHTPDREKTWVACDDHRASLSEHLDVRGFLRRVDRLQTEPATGELPRRAAGEGEDGTGRSTVLDNGVVRMEFTATAADTDGRLHEVRATYEPASPLPPAHLHPAQAERFEVHEGALEFVVEGVRRTVVAGETIEIPAGAVHQARNPAEVRAVVTWQTRPALRTGEFLCAVAAARSAGDDAQLLRVVEEYSDVFRLAPQPAAPS